MGDNAYGNDVAAPLVKPEHLKYVWMGTLVVVLLGLGLSPWETIGLLLEEGGVGEQGTSILAFIAGYTLPLTVGIGICAWLGLRGFHQDMDPGGVLVGVALVLFVAGFVAAEMGLGLLPTYDHNLISGHPMYTFPIWVLQGYFNSYGFGLMVSSAAIGGALALSFDTFQATT